MGYVHGEVVHDYSGPALDVELAEGALVLGTCAPGDTSLDACSGACCGGSGGTMCTRYEVTDD